MKTMDIDCGTLETEVVFKNTGTRTIKKKTYSYNEISQRDLLEHLYFMAKTLGIDEVHIEINGYGAVAYDYFITTDLEGKVIPLKYDSYGSIQ